MLDGIPKVIISIKPQTGDHIGHNHCDLIGHNNYDHIDHNDYDCIGRNHYDQISDNDLLVIHLHY